MGLQGIHRNAVSAREDFLGLPVAGVRLRHYVDLDSSLEADLVKCQPAGRGQDLQGPVAVEQPMTVQTCKLALSLGTGSLRNRLVAGSIHAWTPPMCAASSFKDS